MPYLITCPPGTSVSVLKAVGELRMDDGKLVGYDHQASIRYRAEVLDDDELSPAVKELIDGDENGMNGDAVKSTKASFRKITDTQAAKYREEGTPISENDDVEVRESDFNPLAEQKTKQPTGAFGGKD